MLQKVIITKQYDDINIKKNKDLTRKGMDEFNFAQQDEYFLNNEINAWVNYSSRQQ